MKQFAQCAQCQQWYVRAATASVEIYQSDRLHCVVTWCISCIQAAEQRSGSEDRPADISPTLSSPVLSYESTLTDTFQQLIEEHLALMDRALHDDEAVLVPNIKDFLERGGVYQAQCELPEQRQRLTGHIHYWETFLKALHMPC